MALLQGCTGAAGPPPRDDPDAAASSSFSIQDDGSALARWQTAAAELVRASLTEQYPGLAIAETAGAPRLVDAWMSRSVLLSLGLNPGSVQTPTLPTRKRGFYGEPGVDTAFMSWLVWSQDRSAPGPDLRRVRDEYLGAIRAVRGAPAAAATRAWYLADILRAERALPIRRPDGLCPSPKVALDVAATLGALARSLGASCRHAPVREARALLAQEHIEPTIAALTGLLASARLMQAHERPFSTPEPCRDLLADEAEFSPGTAVFVLFVCAQVADLAGEEDSTPAESITSALDLVVRTDGAIVPSIRLNSAGVLFTVQTLINLGFSDDVIARVRELEPASPTSLADRIDHALALGLVPGLEDVPSTTDEDERALAVAVVNGARCPDGWETAPGLPRDPVRDEVALHDLARMARAFARCARLPIDPEAATAVQSHGAQLVEAIRSMSDEARRSGGVVAYWRVVEARCAAGLRPQVSVPLLTSLLPRVEQTDTRLQINILQLHAGSRLAAVARAGSCGDDVWPLADVPARQDDVVS